MRHPWTDEIRNPAGEIVRVVTRRLGLTVYRQRTGKEPNFTWGKQWSWKKMIVGELGIFSLGTDLSSAIALAEEIASFLDVPTNMLADARAKYNPRALARKTALSTIGEILEHHTNHFAVLGISRQTGEDYQRRLINIVRVADSFRRGKALENLSGRRDIQKTEWPKWLALSSDIFTAKLLIDYKRATVGAIEDDPDADEEDVLTAKISCDSTIRTARSVFSQEALKLYRESDLVLPEMGTEEAPGPLRKFLSVSLYGAKKYFELLPDRTIRGIFEASVDLKKNDLNAYRVFFAATQLGLRRGEISSLRMSWFEDEKPPVLKLRENGKFAPKHGHGRTVVIQPWAWEEIQAITASPDYFIEQGEGAAGSTERTELAPERLIKWLQQQGVAATKPLHELRKLWFSSKAKIDGLHAAQVEGGHRSNKTTTDFYASHMMKDRLLPFWKEPTDKALKGA